MIEQHSASLPLDLAGTIQWRLRRDPEKWVFAHAMVSFSIVNDTAGSPQMIVGGITLADLQNPDTTLANCTFQLALIDGIVPSRHYLVDYAPTLLRQLIRMSGEVRDDMIPLVAF